MTAGMRGRERKFAGAVLGDVEKDGSFSGYASLFGEADLGKDVMERGAFAASLKARGADGVRMLYQHDPGQPIGVWTDLREDARGLFVRGQLNLGVERAREVLALMRGGALDGLSIGFRTVRARKDAGGLRRVLEADLWEISVVTFPMQPKARVSNVKRMNSTEAELQMAVRFASGAHVLKSTLHSGSGAQPFSLRPEPNSGVRS